MRIVGCKVVTTQRNAYVEIAQAVSWPAWRDGADFCDAVLVLFAQKLLNVSRFDPS